MSLQQALRVPVLWVAWLGIPEPHGMNSSPRNTRGCRTFKPQLGDTSCHRHLRLCTKVDRWILVLPGQRACIPHCVGVLHRLRGQKRPSDFIFKSVPHEELRRLEGAAGSQSSWSASLWCVRGSEAGLFSPPHPQSVTSLPLASPS